MDTTRSEKAASSKWLADALTILGISALWSWIVFDLCTGRRRVGFLDYLWLFVGPMIVWRIAPRMVEAWKARGTGA